MILIKRLSLYSVLLLAFCSLLAQSSVFQLRNSLGEKYTGFDVHDIDFDEASKEITLSGLNWTKGWLNEKKEADGGKKLSIVTGAGIRGTEVSQPVVTILTLDASGRVLNKTEEAIHLSGVFSKLSKEDPYVVNNYSSLRLWIDSNDAKPVEELKSQFPKAFPKEGADYETLDIVHSTELFRTYLVKQVSTFEYQEWKGDYKITPGEIQNYTYEKDGRSESSSGGYIFDKKRKQVVYPVRVEVTDRYSPYYNKQVYVLDENGGILNSSAITLEQPKDLKYIGGFGDQNEDQSFTNGAILIYGKAQLGKKKNDPDLTRHYVVILDGDGNVTVQSEFHLDEEVKLMDLYSSYKADDKMYVFGRIIAKENSGHILMEFDQNGYVKSTLYKYQDMMGLVKGDAEQGLKTSYSRKFEPFITTSLENGGVVVFGETYEIVKERLTAQPGQTMGDEITHNYRLSTVFLEFDPSGKWVGYYSEKRPEEKTEKKVEMTVVETTSDAIYYHDAKRKKLLVLNLKNGSVKGFDSVEKIIKMDDGKMMLFNEWNSGGNKEFKIQIIE